MPEMNIEQAEELLEMFADGKEIGSLNTSLALHLVDLARELGRDALVGRLLSHAANAATSEEDRGWCQFELLKHEGADKDALIGLAFSAEKENLTGLAAGILHHVALLSLGTEDAGIFANKSMRLREESDDKEGMIYGHALVAHIAKENEDWESAGTHLRKRIELIDEKDHESLMEAYADLAHTHATIGELEQAQALLIDSLNIANELQDLSGILVAKWGLADLAEISEQPDEAMIQLSDIMTAFMEEDVAVPEPVKERISKLTESQ
jgi:tetratricopeptide (TPR) repeat protein